MKIISYDNWSSFVRSEEKSILELLKGQPSDYLVGVIDLFIEDRFQYIVLEYCAVIFN